METKICFKCGEEKPLSEFYKHPKMKDGRVNKCKDCNKKDVQQNYRKNIDYYKEYEKERNKKRWDYKTNQCKIWRKKNPEKYKAHSAVSAALKSGKIFEEPCKICGEIKNIHAHHEDYSKPLDVVWLCPQCHKNVHEGRIRLRF